MTSAADRTALPEVDDLYLAYATGKASSKAETDKLRREIKSLQVQLAEARNATLEEAAKVCEDVWPETRGQFIGDVIRALKTVTKESA